MQCPYCKVSAATLSSRDPESLSAVTHGLWYTIAPVNKTHTADSLASVLVRIASNGLSFRCVPCLDDDPETRAARLGLSCYTVWHFATEGTPDPEVGDKPVVAVCKGSIYADVDPEVGF